MVNRFRQGISFILPVIVLIVIPVSIEDDFKSKNLLALLIGILIIRDQIKKLWTLIFFKRFDRYYLYDNFLFYWIKPVNKCLKVQSTVYICRKCFKKIFK